MNKKRKVLLTGASSFIGLNLALEIKESFDLHCCAQSPENSSNSRTLRYKALKNKVENSLIELNLQDDSSIIETINRIKPDIFIHHGGYAKDYGSNDKYDFKKSLDVNVLPLGAIYQALADAGCQQVISTGTSAEYSDSKHPHSEEEACNPSSLYGLSKLSQSKYLKILSEKYKIPTRVIRVFNVFGAYENEGKLFSLIRKAIQNNEPIELTDCLQKRSLLSINQLAEVYIETIKKSSELGLYEILNATNTGNHTLREFFPSRARWDNLLLFGRREMRASEAPILLGSPDKLQRKLGISFDLLDVQKELESFLLASD